MKLLVCGGAGFIGSAYIKNHLRANPSDTITNLDSLTIGSNIENLKEIETNPNHSFIKDDIRNQESVSNIAKNSDVLVNFAAQTHPVFCHKGFSRSSRTQTERLLCSNKISLIKSLHLEPIPEDNCPMSFPSSCAQRPLLHRSGSLQSPLDG
jgi:hypothetical protein